MKRADLREGVTYSDGKKGLRRIVAFGAQYKLYDHQADEDCLLYAIVAGARSPYPRGKSAAGERLMHSTATSFAAWAKSEVRSLSPIQEPEQ